MSRQNTPDVPSLRFRLLLWLLVPGLVLAAGLLTKNYLGVKEVADRVQDRLLVALAVTISEHVINSSGDMLSRDIELLLSQFTREDTYYRVNGPNGAFVTGHYALPELSVDTPIQPGVPQFYNTVYLGEDVRVVTMKYLVSGSGLQGWVTIDVTQTRRERDRLVRDELLGSATDFVVLMILGGLFAWIGVTRGLAPLQQLQQAIRRRSTDDLRPIRHVMPREVSEVVFALNGLLERLERSISANQRFITDASHQLRTPLATIQAEVEWARRHASNEADRDALDRILAETRQTARLATQLLNLARVSPEGRKATSASRVDLVDFAARVTSDWVRPALRHGIDLGFEDHSNGMSCHVDNASEVLLREMLVNLIENALAYCLEGSSVTVRVIGPASAIGPVLEIEDDGPGIPLADRQRVLDRFVRLDGSNNHGCGLGLSIVREVADAHRADLILDDGARGRGLKISVVFPF
ncbi:MAG: sensor histidine kinase [Pseudomonadota bacterium]